MKNAVKKDSKNLIEHPILFREVFIYIHITAYCLHIFYKLQVVSNLDRRLKGVCVSCLPSNIQGLEFPVVYQHFRPTAFRLLEALVKVIILLVL